MHRVVVMQGVVQVLFQLCKETGGYEGGGRGVYAWFALFGGEVSQCSALREATLVGYGHEE